jgi:small GTP-binding protein
LKHILCVVVGDGAVGKTCLLLSASLHAFSNEPCPTVFAHDTASVMVEDQQINLQLWDTAGQADLPKNPSMAYSHTNILVIRFSLVSPTSLEIV